MGSLLPFPAKEILGTTNHAKLPASSGYTVLSVHRVYHIVSFGATALLLLLVCRNWRQELAVTVFTFLLGAAVEVTQCFLYGTALEWWDIRDDGWGTVAALIVAQAPFLRTWLVLDPV